MKTVFCILFAIGAFVASSEAKACKQGNSCNDAPRELTKKVGGNTYCCMSGGMSLSGRSVNGVMSVKCTCFGAGTYTVASSSGSTNVRKPFKVTPLKEFRKAALEEHNKLRAKHGSPPLKLANDLNAYAQRYAEYLVAINQMVHSNRILPSTGEKMGENLATSRSSGQVDFKGPDAVDLWYAEIKDYNFKKPGFSHATGHFTQVVWKDTRYVGMGKARSADGKNVFAVASYRGPGNVIGLFRKNVLPASS